jgi:integrase
MLGAAMLFAMETGMRRGELLRMRWPDIDREACIAHIPETKNGYARTIPLSAEARRILDGFVGGDVGRVFPITAVALRHAWARLRRRAGLPDLHWHDLRHESVSRFFERGLSMPEVALISGHRDARMLLRYSHPRAEDIARKLG